MEIVILVVVLVVLWFLWKHFGTVLKVVAVCSLLILAWLASQALKEHYLPKMEKGLRVTKADNKQMVVDQADWSEGQRTRESYKNPDGSVSIEKFRETRTPLNLDVALARRAAEEQEAIARGETLPHPIREIKGNQWAWLPTNIPVSSCMHITAAGRIWRKGDVKVGPNGDVEGVYANRDIYRNMRTLLSSLPWGTFIGMVCEDPAGKKCSNVVIPIGESTYTSPDQVGVSGHLWVWTNGFVWSGKAFDNTDFSVMEGGFTFDGEPAPTYKCQAPVKAEQ